MMAFPLSVHGRQSFGRIDWAVSEWCQCALCVLQGRLGLGGFFFLIKQDSFGKRDGCLSTAFETA